MTRIAVTDACIFIDIHELNLTPTLFSLPLDIHTTLDVYNELLDDHKQFLTAFISVNKLTLHTLSGEERIALHQEIFPRSLSENDKTVIFLATKLSATVLSSDKSVRNYAKKLAIEYHGMLWIFDQLVLQNVITKEDSAQKLNELITGNTIYQNNKELMTEVYKRIRQWTKA